MAEAVLESPKSTPTAGARRPQGKTRAPRPSLGALPAIALLSAAGLVAIALGNNAARETEGAGQVLFWVGLTIVYAPIAVRLLSTSASRAERLGLVLLLGVATFLVKVLYSPTFYPPFDELATWRQTSELLHSGHLFADNPIAAGFPGFPGLETVTAAVAQLTGFNVFHSGVVVIGLARVGLVLALFLLLERVTGSARGAGIGVAIYACNPSFLYFDSQFGHESLALMLGAATLLVVVVRAETPRLGERTAAGLLGATILLAAGLAATHHMTSYAVSVFLLVWAALAAYAYRREGVERPARGPLLPALIMTGCAVFWFVFVGGSDTIAELGSVFSDAFHSVVRLLFGGSGPKTLFQGSSQSNTAAARALAFASVIPLLILLPVGLRAVWRSRNPLWQALAAAAVLYPVTLGLRLTLSGTETSQRASEFVFVGLAFFAALVVDRLAMPRARLRRALVGLAFAGVATTMFCGAFIVSELPATRQPGPYLVGGDARSVNAQSLAAARWSAEHLPPDSRVLTDRANGTLLGSYGELKPVLGQIHGISVTRVFFSPTLDRVDREIVRDDEIEYVLVDRRLSRELPILGFYFEPAEPRAYERKGPIAEAALAKFGLAAGMNRIYANGPIAIYATSALREE